MSSRRILDSKKIDIIIERLAYQLIEHHSDFGNIALIGLQPRGTRLAKRIHERVKEITGNPDILYGELDSTFHRDDFRQYSSPIIPNAISIDFIIEKKNVVLIDDVMYTGRSVRAALDALTAFGRPNRVEFLVLINRKYSRELPISPDYVGREVDTRVSEKVKVEWCETAGEDNVWLITNE